MLLGCATALGFLFFLPTTACLEDFNGQWAYKS
jgi:hypothetical protein